MVGYFPHPPNAEGLRWFSTEVLPTLRARYPDAQLHAVGKNPPGMATTEALVVRGFVDDIATEYASAAVVIAPIFAGAGSQIKVIDALANERPLVTSSFALESFAAHLRPAEHVLVADSAAEWVDRCAEVFGHPVVAEEMSSRGHEAVRANFGLDAMVAGVRTTLGTLTAR